MDTQLDMPATLALEEPYSPSVASDLEFRCGDPLQAPRWNELCGAHPDSCVFHTREWIQSLSATYGFRPACLIAGPETAPTVMIPVLDPGARFGRSRAISLPFTDWCPPLIWGEPGTGHVWGAIRSAATRAGWRSIEIRGETGLPASAAAVKFFGHELELVRPAETLLATFAESHRRGIRKAEREGVVTRIERSLEAVRTYYRLHCLTRRRHGLPPQPLRLFAAIHERLIARGLGFVVTALYRNVPVAGALFLQFGRKAVYKFGASDVRYQHLRPNNLVFWEGIRTLADVGCERLHLGRTSMANIGLRRFKLGWGAHENEIRYYKYDLRSDAFLQERDRASGWHNRIFRVMPVWLARMIGSVLYRQFA